VVIIRYILNCTSKWNNKDVIEKYPILNNHNPIIDHPYPNPNAERLTIEVSDLVKFYEEIGEEIIIGKDNDMYYLEIYDDYRE